MTYDLMFSSPLSSADSQDNQAQAPQETESGQEKKSDTIES